MQAKESQRASTSCSECSRRKTRCDKTVPCQNCTRRGKGHLCRVPPHVRKKGDPEAQPEAAPAPGDDIDLLAYSALKEVDDMRSSIEGMKSRITGLEALLLQAFSKLKERSDLHPTTYHSPPNHQPFFASSSSTSSSAAAGPSFTLPPLQPNGYAHNSLKLEVNQGHDIMVDVPASLQPLLTSTTTSEAGQRDDSAGQEDLREEEVAASLSLEFMALGRNRSLAGPASMPQFSETPSLTSFAGLSTPSAQPSSLLYDPSSLPPNPTSLFPTTASLAGVIPPFAETQAILRHALDWTGWYHGCCHAPTFEAEVAEFWSLGDKRVELVNPSWLALFFAQLSSGVKHMTREQLSALGTYGLSEDEAKTLSKTHQQASLACLYRSNFLESHQFFSVQTIAILVITGQDGGDGLSNLFPTLLTVGISIAQDLGLHRLDSEEAWQASVAGASPQARAKSLITYEMQKRVFWALAAQDWFSIPYRRTTAVQPTQVTSPLPANARDEDLLTGVYINRPPSEYTVASNTLIWVQFARILQQVYAHIDENPTLHSHAYVLKLDAQMQGIIDNIPVWMREGGPTEGMPPAQCSAWVRTTFAISSAHKVLTLHRPFLHRAFRDPRFESSRKRALDASRTILREGAKAGDVRMWTVPYHISAAASVVCLDLFQRGSSKSVLDAERHEVQAALVTLRNMEPSSPIAARGVALIENLLAEESRIVSNPSLVPSGSQGPPSKRKRKSEALDHDRGSRDFTSFARKVANSAAHEMATSLATPLTLSPPLTFQLPTLDSATAADYSPSSTASDRGTHLFDNEYGVHEEAIPPEFFSAFLGSGFDPLELLSATPGPWGDSV
ncbi:hypothetical protein BCR35DRAFT_302847 [Leucosporidium creatinivorum]|uniref:Zn(2)-C6 fungal-type domain-containing protein n=1 Tax=Leucosporidium creatinivorum TaxID=106004 RepID=A0A1Y2FN16_9BASI|nr:hypothetical protein BCR35DRAFT_302847 [Leucosporidium creatinivorum]